MIRVNSSNLFAVEYIDNILIIQFNSGAVYEYYNVPSDVYQGLLNAKDSHGMYFSRFIKNSYSYKKIV